MKYPERLHIKLNASDKAALKKLAAERTHGNASALVRQVVRDLAECVEKE
jgi:hypothetical protein